MLVVVWLVRRSQPENLTEKCLGIATALAVGIYTSKESEKIFSQVLKESTAEKMF